MVVVDEFSRTHRFCTDQRVTLVPGRKRGVQTTPVRVVSRRPTRKRTRFPRRRHPFSAEACFERSRPQGDEFISVRSGRRHQVAVQVADEVAYVGGLEHAFQPDYQHIFGSGPHDVSFLGVAVENTSDTQGRSCREYERKRSTVARC